MKLNKLFLSAGLCAVAMSGCTDLEVNVESQYTTDPIEGSGIDPTIIVEGYMANIYYHMSGTLGRRYMEAACLSSDEFTPISFESGYVDGHVYDRPAFHNSTAADASLDWYSEVTSGITKANEILDKISSMGTKYTAPARAIRAYYTWILMDFFGDTPIMDHTAVVGETFARSPRAEVARWIESELTEIIPLLDTDVTADNYGKPTRWMAEALLAKIYINWAVYTADAVENYDAATAYNEKLEDCITLCDDIISGGKFNLGSMEYRFKFSYDNSWKVEDFIYAMPYDAITRQGFQWARPRTFKQMKNMLPNYYGSSEKFSQSFGGNMVLTPEMAARFDALDANDQRRLSVLGGKVYNRDPKTLLPTDEPFLYNGVQVVFTKEVNLMYHAKENSYVDVGNDDAAYQQGYHSIKWFIVPTDYNNGRNQSNDLPIFRYADILLTKAEALVRGGKTGAMELVNQVRTYAKANPLSAEPTLEQIYDERAIELFDECWRRNDMIRFGHYEDEFCPHYHRFEDNAGASFDKRRRIFPVEQEVLDLNDGWKQNPGY